jgi:hypothetical protein
LQQAGEGEVTRDCQLHQRIIGLVIAGDARKRGQEQVHGQRAQTRDHNKCDDVRRRCAIEQSGRFHCSCFVPSRAGMQTKSRHGGILKWRSGAGLTGLIADRDNRV